jgi:hypothetical protein
MLEIAENYKLDPEMLEFTDQYLATLDLTETCKNLGISEEQGAEFLRKKEVKRFIDTTFLEQGYMNRFKIKDVMEKAIMSKLEEAEETGMYTKYDLLELLKFMHQMRMDEVKSQNQSPNNQINVQNNYGENLGNLLSKIVK